MYLVSNHATKSFIFFGLVFFYINFFINLISDDRASFSLVYIIIGLLLVYLLKQKTLFIHPYIMTIGISSILFITLNEYIFHPNQSSQDPEFNQLAVKYIHQFIYIIPFIFLATLFRFSNFTARTFQNIIFFSLLFSIILNTYLNIHFNFDRGSLALKFKSIILYDYCLIALSLISLIFSFQLKNKYAYFWISLSLINIAMIVLHGSRGAWLGIPIALLLITLYFYKAQFKTTIFMIIMAFSLTFIMIYMPNSPIMDRIDHLENDTALMENDNYNTSVGTRFALWNFALDRFNASPYVGNGFINFKNQICQPSSRDEVPNCQPHAHNIILQELATHGVLGILNLFIIFFLPMFFFIKNIVKNPNTKFISFSGVITLIYLGISSMSDYLFFFSFPTMFTFLITLTFMNIIYVENLYLKTNNVHD